MMSDFDLYQQLVGVAVVFGLLGALLYLLARRSGARPWLSQLRNRQEKHIHLVDRLYITPQHSLCLVRLGSQVLLVSVHPGGCSLLHSVPPESLGSSC